MSNIFSTNEMEEIVRRIEETYNVSGKQVKLTIEIIDDTFNKETQINLVKSKRDLALICIEHIFLLFQQISLLHLHIEFRLIKFLLPCHFQEFHL